VNGQNPWISPSIYKTADKTLGVGETLGHTLFSPPGRKQVPAPSVAFKSLLGFDLRQKYGMAANERVNAFLPPVRQPDKVRKKIPRNILQGGKVSDFFEKGACP
jgi:hypothetical protein